MRTKKILTIVIAGLMAWLAILSFFRGKYKVLVINDIDRYAFNDTLIYARLYKDDEGAGVETQIKNYDTPFCFNGKDGRGNRFYFSYAKKGDVIIKQKNADSFFIKRGDIIVGFGLLRCSK